MGFPQEQFITYHDRLTHRINASRYYFAFRAL